MRLHILVLYFLSFTILSAQESNGYWILNDRIGLSFATSPPQREDIFIPNSNDWAGVRNDYSVYSENGRPIIICDGIEVRNKNFEQEISALYGRPFAYQSNHILNHSDDNSSFFVVTTQGNALNFYNGEVWLYDMLVDNDNISIISEPIMIAPLQTDALCLMPGVCNSKWILTRGRGSNTFLASEISRNGLERQVVTSTGPTITSDHMGRIVMEKLVSSPLGNTFAIGNSWNDVNLYAFDSCMATIAHIAELGIVDASLQSHVSPQYSPDGSYLYVLESQEIRSIGGSQRRLFQYDIRDLDTPNLSDSRTLVFQDTTSDIFDEISDMRVGPDGVMYISLPESNLLSAITNPNAPSDELIFIKDYFVFPRSRNDSYANLGTPSLTLPPIEEFDVLADSIQTCDISLELTAVGISGDLLWSTGETTPSIVVSESGKYTLEVFTECCIQKDSTVVLLDKVFQIPEELKTITTCSPKNILIDLENLLDSIKWIDGSRDLSYHIDTFGLFPFEGYRERCLIKDTIEVLSQVSGFIGFLPSDTTICQAQPTLRFDLNSFDSIRWNTEDFGSEITLTGSGDYIAKAYQSGCEYRDTIEIIVEESSDEHFIVVQGDLCIDESVELTSPYLSTVWSDQSATQNLIIDVPGVYWAIAQSPNGCLLRDTVVISASFIEISIDTVVCHGEQVVFGDRSIATSGLYVDTLYIMTGCDTIISLDLEVLEEIALDTIEITFTQRPFNYNGIDYPEEGYYEETKTNTYGCDSTVIIEIINNEEVETPSRSIVLSNIFSPNNDGMNDSFVFDLPEGLLIEETAIYDRWGSEIYASNNNVDPEWRGKIRGQEAPPGVYFYRVSYRDKEGNRGLTSGDITLIR